MWDDGRPDFLIIPPGRYNGGSYPGEVHSSRGGQQLPVFSAMPEDISAGEVEDVTLTPEQAAEAGGAALGKKVSAWVMAQQQGVCAGRRWWPAVPRAGEHELSSRPLNHSLFRSLGSWC